MNFDEVINREGYSSYKIELATEYFGTKDLLPLWVADMDIRTPDFIMNAIGKRCEHEILGYTVRDKDFFNPILKWLEEKHDWRVDNQWIDFVGGVVPAIAMAINTFTEEGDAIIVQTPVYPPFMSVTLQNRRKLICNELVLKGDKYEINFDLFEKQVKENSVKMFIFCSPHNPGGRIWTKEEQMKIATICAENNVLVISDEIHADLALWTNKHIPFATISEEAKMKTITLMSPSKTFNIPGLGGSFYVIPNEKIKEKYDCFINKLECRGGNIFAYTAMQAAYTQGHNWLEEMKNYLQENISYVEKFLKKNIPQLKVMIPQASFLLWIDFRDLGLNDEELRKLLVEKAKLGLNFGTTFGLGGSGFARLNIACSRLLLEEAMKRLNFAINS